MRENGEVEVEGNSCNMSFIEGHEKKLQSSIRFCAESSDGVIIKMFFEPVSFAMLARNKASDDEESPSICSFVPGCRVIPRDWRVWLNIRAKSTRGLGMCQARAWGRNVSFSGKVFHPASSHRGSSRMARDLDLRLLFYENILVRPHILL